MKPSRPPGASGRNRWSQQVTARSNALDLEPGVFRLEDPHVIALSLKRSAERIRRRRTTPFRSAMSMLNFFINRAGSQLAAEQRARLEAAKANCAPCTTGRAGTDSSAQVAKPRSRP